MQYVYILQSEYDDNLYVGCTNNLKKRIVLHNEGKIASTKSRTPFKLIYYESFLSKKDAYERERFYKTGWGKRNIKKTLYDYFNN